MNARLGAVDLRRRLAGAARRLNDRTKNGAEAILIQYSSRRLPDEHKALTYGLRGFGSGACYF